MKAGRDLDALVAEKVMGWKAGDGTELGLRDGEVQTLMDCRAWSPSTDIAAAWEVVERIRTLPHALTLQAQQSPGGNWRARLYSNAKNSLEDWYQHLEVEEIGDTAPHAICLAALRAVGAGT